jgi:hypothetical protein
MPEAANKANDDTESDLKTTELLSAENQKDADEANANVSSQKMPETANKANDQSIRGKY